AGARLRRGKAGGSARAGRNHGDRCQIVLAAAPRAGPNMVLAPPREGGAMIVAARDIAARCRKCGKSDFKPLSGGDLRLATVMACTACGQKTTYRDLLEQ